jgi:hypothetical protein
LLRRFSRSLIFRSGNLLRLPERGGNRLALRPDICGVLIHISATPGQRDCRGRKEDTPRHESDFPFGKSAELTLIRSRKHKAALPYSKTSAGSERLVYLGREQCARRPTTGVAAEEIFWTTERA